VLVHAAQRATRDARSMARYKRFIVADDGARDRTSMRVSRSEI
jgi:hypothetical protein